MSSSEKFEDSTTSLSGAIDRALAFLQKRQLPTGEFETRLSSSPTLEESIFDSSPFVTTHVLHAIHGLERPAVAEMARRALNFLLSEENFGGLWRYYSMKKWKHFRIPPDLDDTACVSYVLELYGESAPKNRWIFRRNRDSEGRFLTWVEPRPNESFLSPIRLIRSIGDKLARKNVPERPPEFIGVERFALETDAVPLEDADPVVNANVLLYLGDCPETESVAPWLAEVIERGPQDGFSLYYRNPLTLFYAVSRATTAGVASLEPLRLAVVQKTSSLSIPDGPFCDPLSTAFALNILGSLDPENGQAMPTIDHLLKTQRSDGAWPAAPFYSGPTEFWGSQELTTALAIEALSKFEKEFRVIE